MDFRRTLQATLHAQLKRGKSVLLLGPRQTGKTTLIDAIPADFRLSLVSPSLRNRYERDPSLLAGEVRALRTNAKAATPPLVVVDEVQKVPTLMDVAQELIDRKEARFILTGSSARKLRRGQEVNLLPGRVVMLRLDPLTLEEDTPKYLDEILYHGALPAIRKLTVSEEKEIDLRSYVETYLEEEVRQEALVRDLGKFSRFLELAGIQSGRVSNFSRIAEDTGISAVTVRNYFEILVDCLVAERVEPITESTTRKRLTRANRYLIFDLGVRRLAAREGVSATPERRGELFEEFVGLELIRFCRLHSPRARIRFWRDPDGPEVDWVVEIDGTYVPVEVKWTERPRERDARSLRIFLEEYSNAARGFIVCRTPSRVQIAENIVALPWKDFPSNVLDGIQ